MRLLTVPQKSCSLSHSLRNLPFTSIVQVPYDSYVKAVTETRASGTLPLCIWELDSGGFYLTGSAEKILGLFCNSLTEAAGIYKPTVQSG